jgi:hypothetical protein
MNRLVQPGLALAALAAITTFSTTFSPAWAVAADPDQVGADPGTAVAGSTLEAALLWDEPVEAEQTIAQRSILVTEDVEVASWAAENDINDYQVVSRGSSGAIIQVSMYESEWQEVSERACGQHGVQGCEASACQKIQLTVNAKAIGASPEDRTSVRLLRQPSLTQILDPEAAGDALCPTTGFADVPLLATDTGNGFELPDEAIPDDTDCWTLAVETSCNVIKTPLSSVVPPEEPLRVLALVDGNVGPQLASAYGVRLLRSVELKIIQVQLVVFELNPQQDKQTILGQLNADTRVNAAQPDYIYRTSARYGDPYAFMSYGPEMTGAVQLHASTRGGGKTVAVIDTGADIEHPELAEAITGHEDFTGRGWSADLHGTAVAGIIAAKPDNSEGSYGVAPEVKLLLLKACQPYETGSLSARCWTSTIAEALDHAASAKTPVINMSLGGPPDPLVTRVVQAVVATGQLIVAAAGNGGPAAKPAFPAALPDVLAVTAIDARNRSYAGATLGEFIDIAAPGVDIVSPAPDGTYPALSGTSMATAHASGVAALLLDLAPLAAAPEIRATILSAVTDLGATGTDTQYGEGLIDACSAANHVTSGAVICGETTDD